MKAVDVKNDDVMKKMLPIHPMAALVLKNIASAFQSNQRSMFDFIKTPRDLDAHAFQWFIQNTSPLSDRRLLTIDMLWDFFYEKGKDYLTSDIKLILDTYPQQANLIEKEKVVLKTILIMQAVDQRLGGAIPLLKPTDQSLSYAFEGDAEEYANECKGLAKGLVDKGILIKTPGADGRQVYAAAVLAGDSAKIDKFKEDIRKLASISKLVEEGEEIATSLSLTPPLRLRYSDNMDKGSLPVVTIHNFTKVMDQLKVKDFGWHFYAVLAVAKTEDEAIAFRNQIKKTISNEDYKNIIVVDTLSTPLGREAFEEYVNYSAMANYYTGNNAQQAKENGRKAKEVLSVAWRSRLHDGSFIVWSYSNQDGEKAAGINDVYTIMRTFVLQRFEFVPDFTKGLTENQLKVTQAKQVARYGFKETDVKGLIAGCENRVLNKVWNVKEYWKDPDLETDPFSIIKLAVDDLISKAFKENGRISIETICLFLEETYGYAPSNLTAFIVGFLLKEYKSEPYRFLDYEGHQEQMTCDKLAETIGNFYSRKSKSAYIVSLTPEEKSFYELTEKAWRINPDSCSSISQAINLIQKRMRDFIFPVWALEDVDDNGVFDIVKKYMELIQNEADKAHSIAIEIGKINLGRNTYGDNLRALLTEENCLKGMSLFIQHFEDGKLNSLANDIRATGHLLADIKRLFSVKYAALWNLSTGEDEIRKLIIEYSFVKVSNNILNVQNSTKEDTFKAWCETLKFLGLSGESLKAKFPNMSMLFTILQKVANHEDILPTDLKTIYDELTLHNTELHSLIGSPLDVFMDLYSPYLNGFTPEECEDIKNSITEDMFVLSSTRGNEVVKKAATDYRKNQVKNQLSTLWSSKTNGSKTPMQWSTQHRTPILCCIDPQIYNAAKKAFSVLNGGQQGESEIKNALDFLENATFFESIADRDFRDKCFFDRVVKSYAGILTDINQIRDRLESISVPAYEWGDDPLISDEIKKMAEEEYYSGGSDSVISAIDAMTEDQLKKWLKDLVEQDIEFGAKIISCGGKES